ncbi:hypothetical protein LCGC14_0529290 [marine sediment metagenome]|uniref:Uncharacterized protein n=1 Tax=marine sediment metagenome TaxID=412755 RepID=A0A0F9RWA9_9ZZZZ
MRPYDLKALKWADIILTELVRTGYRIPTLLNRNDIEQEELQVVRRLNAWTYVLLQHLEMGGEKFSAEEALPEGE